MRSVERLADLIAQQRQIDDPLIDCPLMQSCPHCDDRPAAGP